MADIRRITERIAVAPQICVEDVKEIAAQGFRTLMNNRPDGEAPDQTPSAAIEAEAKKQGVAYVYLPIVSSAITPQNIADFGKVLTQAEGPILAYCRTGTRCTNMWALAEAGNCGTDQLLKAAAEAGYDLRGLAPTLDALAGQRKSGPPAGFRMAEDALIPAAHLTDLVAALFQADGMRAEDARIVADILVWADLRGVESHGVERVPRYAALMKSGQMQADAIPQVQPVAGAAFRIDSRKSLGPVAMMKALETAEPLARQNGVALGVIANSTHTGAIGYYAEWAARRGLAAIVVCAGMPLMAWPGTKAPSVSTSPLAIGAPGGPDGALVFDMSTAIAASGRLRKAMADKTPIPEGWALDAEGRPATDPAKAVTSLPVGGAKGAGLSLMIEILCGVLGGFPVVGPMLQPGAPRPHSSNGMAILIDIAKFRPVADFCSDVDLLANAIKGLARFEDAEPVRMPGERGSAELARRTAQGVPLNARLAGALAKMAGERKIALPQALAGFA